MSHEALRADIVLTIYQTNYHEAISYIAGQSKFYLVMALATVALATYGDVKLVQSITRLPYDVCNTRYNYLLLAVVLLSIFYAQKYLVNCKMKLNT